MEYKRHFEYSRAVGGADVRVGRVRRARLLEVLGTIVGDLQPRAGGGAGGRVAVGVGGRGDVGAVGVVVGHRARVRAPLLLAAAPGRPAYAASALVSWKCTQS